MWYRGRLTRSSSEISGRNPRAKYSAHSGPTRKLTRVPTFSRKVEKPLPNNGNAASRAKPIFYLLFSRVLQCAFARL